MPKNLNHGSYFYLSTLSRVISTHTRKHSTQHKSQDAAKARSTAFQAPEDRHRQPKEANRRRPRGRGGFLWPRHEDQHGALHGEHLGPREEAPHRGPGPPSKQEEGLHQDVRPRQRRQVSP